MHLVHAASDILQVDVLVSLDEPSAALGAADPCDLSIAQKRLDLSRLTAFFLESVVMALLPGVLARLEPSAPAR